MLGFGKKKKQEAEAAATPAEPDAATGQGAAEPVPEPVAAPAKPSRKKRFSIKKLLIIIVVLAILGGGGFAAYTFFFASKGPGQRVYKAAPLTHVKLPQEMVKFCFDHFPGLYDAFLVFETEVNLLETEILRIDAIAGQYPEQEKIAQGQKKIWEKGKNTLLKEFAKLEKPVKETFVLFQVNPRQGQAQIEAKSKELTDTAQEALKTARELTQEIKAMSPKAPDGIIQGTLYKLKKKFL